jgi:hypothetical protein
MIADTAARSHNLVREDLAAADRRRISACFNRLAAVWTLYIYGADTAPPAFEFVRDEDLQADRAWAGCKTIRGRLAAAGTRRTLVFSIAQTPFL